VEALVWMSLLGKRKKDFSRFEAILTSFIMTLNSKFRGIILNENSLRSNQGNFV
jgi:hypothetical protein